MPNLHKGYNSKIISTLCNQLTSCNCRVNEECPMGCKCRTVDAVYDVVSLHQSREKSTLCWQKENGRKGIITMKSH